MELKSYPSKVLLLGTALAFALGLQYAVAWTAPSATPPGSNVAAPINVSSTDQVKNAGLSVNALSVFGNALFQGSTTIGGTSNPTQVLDVLGPVKLGGGTAACTASVEGSVRYNTSSDTLEFCNGASWATVGGALSKVSTQTVTGSSNISFSVAPGNHYRVIFNLTRSAAGRMYMRFNNVSSNVYHWQNYVFPAGVANTYGQNVAQIENFSYVDSPANSWEVGSFDIITYYSSTTMAAINGMGNHGRTDCGAAHLYYCEPVLFSGLYHGPSAVSTLNIIPNVGTYTGQVTLFKYDAP